MRAGARAASPGAEEACLSLQAGFTLGILILVFTGLLMLYCCYVVLQSPKPIRESRTHLRSHHTPAHLRTCEPAGGCWRSDTCSLC